MKIRSQVQRGLPAELDNDAKGFFFFNDMQHIFPGQGLKIEFVRGVIIRGYGFRVGIDHDGFHPLFPQGKGGMDTAVVKFNALADAVGAAAQDDDLFSVRHPGFTFRFIG